MMNSKPLTFADFSFSPELARAVEEMGFASPTPIQQQTIPLLMEGATDFLGLASTGTGKTAAFAIPLLEQLDPSIRDVQALILCPTRELARQVTEQINLLARYKKTKAIAIYGGSDYSGQLRALRDGVSIVVGTPGRIIDHLDRGTLRVENLRTAVLDEADEMISMGFREEIESILARIDDQVALQKWMFSATMSRDIRKITETFLRNPKQVQINKDTGGAASTVVQQYFPVHEDQKMGLLGNLIDSAPDFHGLIFCQTKLLVEDITRQLKIDGYAAECLHGDMDQKARERVMKGFKSAQVKVLVCTDVASRGIDVKGLTHVINYSLPRELENYVHRIGRTGRAGKDGVAWNLVNPSHMNLVPRIEMLTKVKMIRSKFPEAKDILRAKAERALIEFNTLAGVEGADTTLATATLLATGWKEVLESMSKEEIAARFLARTLKVNAVAQSLYDEPRKKEGSSRFDRRQEFVDRTRKPWKKDGGKFNRDFKGDRNFGDKKPFGEKKTFGDKKPFGEKKTFGDQKPFAGKSKKPAFATFKDPKFQRAVSTDW
jgi:ATP-dependent RNA helicase DeaD